MARVTSESYACHVSSDSQGLTLTALFGASVDALSSAAFNESDDIMTVPVLLEKMNIIWAKILLPAPTEDDLRFIPTAIDGCLSLQINLTNNVGASRIATKTIEDLCQLFSLEKMSLVDLPVWVKTTMVEILQRIKHADPNGTSSFSLSTCAKMLGTVLCLYWMKVEEFTYDPIPVNLQPTRQTPLGGNGSKGIDVRVIRELMKNLTIQPDSRAGCSPPCAVCLAILGTVAQTDQSLTRINSPLTVLSVGYGFDSETTTKATLVVGKRANDDNLCPKIGQPRTREVAPPEPWLEDSVTLLECNLDDMTGEHLAFAIETLLKQDGALDAWISAIVMKKGRPAHTLHCLCSPESEDHMKQTLFRHTTSLGVRISRSLPRAKLYRRVESRQTEFVTSKNGGVVDVKISHFRDGEVISTKAEFDHCRVVSQDTGFPIKRIVESALAAAPTFSEIE